MKNKNYLFHFSIRSLLVTFMLLIIFTGCNDDKFLEEKPLDFLTSTNAYSTKAGIDQAIIGLYADVRDKWYRNGGQQSYGLFGMGTDVGYDGETPGGQRFLTNYVTSVNPDYSVIRYWWLYLYKHIQEANMIITGIEDPDSEITWVSDAEKNVPIAEARFFRAWSHWIAVTLWGDVPLVNYVVDEAKVDFVRDPKSEVYAQIEDDLIFAGQNLPVRGDEAQPGKLTQGAAKHLLAQVYLAQSKWQDAVNAASSVINDYGYAVMTQRFGAQNDVFGSGDVYWDLFRYNNQNAAENTETIWAIQFEPLVEIGGSSNYWSGIYGPRTFSWGKTPDGYNAFVNAFQDTLGRPVSRCRGTNLVHYYVWESDWNNDIRNAKHNIKRDFYFDNPASAYYGQKMTWEIYPAGARNVFKDSTNYIYPYFMKTFEPVVQATITPKQGGGGSVSTDFYAMRLAETYLLRAEAYLGLNDKDKAAADINVVRNRAKATPVLPADVDIDYILDERVRELYAEEMRMITLLRMGKLVDRVRRYNDNPMLPGANIADHNNLWPIPQAQIDLNLGADFPQNPGYE